MSGCGAGSANAMAAFLVASITASGNSEALAGIMLALGSIVSIGARISLGIVADTGRLPLLKAVSVLFLGGAAAYALLSTSPAPMVGASGAIFGLAGAAIELQRAEAPGWRRTSIGYVGLLAINALSWLIHQQCADGLWVGNRTDTTVACPAADPNTFAGPDTKSHP